MAYTRDDLIASGLDPRLVDMLVEKSARLQGGSGLTWDKILYQLSPIEKKETEEGTTYFLGPSIRNPLNLLGQILKYSPVSPIYPTWIANKIKEAIGRIKLSPEGVTITNPRATRSMWPSETRFARSWREPAKSAPIAPPKRPSQPPPEEDDRSHLGPVGWGFQTPERETEVMPSEPVVVPSTPAPQELPATPTEMNIDFSKVMKLPKERINLEQELMKIFNEVIPKWEDLPQSEYKAPQTTGEYVSRFLENLAIAASGRDPLEHQMLKKAQAEAEADKKRNYMIQRASQLANFRVLGLMDRIKKEDEELAKQGKWFEFLDKATDGGIWKNPEAVALLSQYYNVDPSEVNTLLNKLRDPKTGELKGIGMTYIDKQLDLIRKSNEITAEMYRQAGIPPDQIPFAIATGKLDTETYLTERRNRAIVEGNIELANKYNQQLETIVKAKSINPKQLLAADTLEKIRSGQINVDKVFGSKEVGAAVVQALLAQAAGLDESVIKEIMQGMFKQKDMKLKDQLALTAFDATSSPEKMQGFMKRYGISPHAWLNAYMGIKDFTGGRLPQPFRLMAERGIDVTKDALKYVGPGAREVTDPFVKILYRKYDQLLRMLHEGFVDPTTGQRKEFKEFKKNPITESEFFTLITAYEDEGEEGLFKAINQIIQDRKARK